MSRFKLLACKVLSREIFTLAANCKNYIDVTTLRQGLHDTPDILRTTLQAEIDKIDIGDDLHSAATKSYQDFDAILLGYGLCSNGICGISSKKYKIVVPRAHDCITLLLGSKEKYKEYFDASGGGVYWYTAGWNENAFMPSEERLEAIYNEYCEKYGEDNADYLIEMEQGWLKEYNKCTFIDWDLFDNSTHIEYTRRASEFLKWKLDIVKGNAELMKDFLNGKWDNDKFLVIEPGQKIEQSYCENIVKAL